MSFCKFLFRILWFSLNNYSVYDVAVWLTAYCFFFFFFFVVFFFFFFCFFFFQKIIRSQDPNCVQDYRTSQDASCDVLMFKCECLPQEKSNILSRTTHGNFLVKFC